MNTPEVERTWLEFWKPLFEAGAVQEGKGLLEQIKDELHDYKLAMDRVPIVYDHVTGNKASKLLTDPAAICALADDHYASIYQENQQ